MDILTGTPQTRTEKLRERRLKKLQQIRRLQNEIADIDAELVVATCGCPASSRDRDQREGDVTA